MMLYMGLNVKNMIAEKLSLNSQNILFMNDAACFLQGEVLAGAAKRFKRAIGLTIGTGIGTSKYKYKLAEDADLWHAPFKDSIAEEYLSTRWFIRRCKELAGVNVEGVKEIAEAYDKEPWVRQVFNEFGKNLAIFLTSFITAEHPEVVVIGGNISKAYKLFLPSLQQRLQQNSIYTPVRIANLGEEAALIGAACSWHGSKVDKSAGVHFQR
jgi:glucokinase